MTAGTLRKVGMLAAAIVTLALALSDSPALNGGSALADNIPQSDAGGWHGLGTPTMIYSNLALRVRNEERQPSHLCDTTCPKQASQWMDSPGNGHPNTPCHSERSGESRPCSALLGLGKGKILYIDEILRFAQNDRV